MHLKAMKLTKVSQFETSTVDLAEDLNKTKKRVNELQKLIEQLQARIAELAETTDPHNKH